MKKRGSAFAKRTNAVSLNNTFEILETLSSQVPKLRDIFLNPSDGSEFDQQLDKVCGLVEDMVFEITCPISLEIPDDPATLEDGNSKVCSMRSLEAMLASCKRRKVKPNDPNTGMLLNNCRIVETQMVNDMCQTGRELNDCMVKLAQTRQRPEKRRCM